MISSEVQRTLVKSPPELWTELSDPEALAKHLGELGEIKITRTEPEKLVEWEAEGTTGTVAIKASGWGTKVTLTVSRDLPPSQDDDAHEQPEAEADPAGLSEPEVPQAKATRRAAGWPPEHTDSGPAIESDLRAAEAEGPIVADNLASTLAQPAPAPADEPVPESQTEDAEQVEPRRGFLARLFGTRRKKAATPVAAEEPGPVSGPAPIPPLAVWHPIPETSDSAVTAEAPSPIEAPDEADIAEDLAAELKAAEETAAEQVEAVLTNVLDRLGAAHHRPFSRS